MQMKITWVPSKKASEAGIVPSDHTIYDIDTEIDPIPESSLEIMLRRAFRHMYNNEVASAWLAESKKAKAESPPREPDRAEFLHKWRTEQRTKILEGKLGMREVSVGPVYTELQLEARLLAFNRVREHITRRGGEFNYKEMNARSLAKEYEGKTVETWIVDLLDETKSKRAARLWELAQENVDRRHAQAAATDEDNDDDFFATSEESEDETESEPETAPAPVAAK
jgi:hypothetical protein